MEGCVHNSVIALSRPKLLPGGVFGITGEATFVHFLQSLSLNFKGLLVSVCQVSSVCLSQFPWTSKRWHTRVSRIFRITPSDQASRSVRPASAESTSLSSS